jgi:hypothetical protein
MEGGKICRPGVRCITEHTRPRGLKASSIIRLMLDARLHDRALVLKCEQLDIAGHEGVQDFLYYVTLATCLFASMLSPTPR